MFAIQAGENLKLSIQSMTFEHESCNLSHTSLTGIDDCKAINKFEYNNLRKHFILHFPVFLNFISFIKMQNI